jgi:hypothetical protein
MLTIDFWCKKLDWTVQSGEMGVLVNVHPDYLCFDGAVASTKGISN